MLTIFTAIIMRMRYELVSTWTTYRYMYTYIHTYIHKYSGFLVVLISVGLAQARPNYTVTECHGKHSFSSKNRFIVSMETVGWKIHAVID